MTIKSAYAGEDVPLEVSYTDSNGAIDPDDQGSDGTPDAEITITDNSDGTEVVSAQSMTNTATGEFEFVWDTSAANGPGTYRVEITAEFGGETKINRSQIQLKE
ncbi:hypothetical protein NP511_02105 [Natrinema thermotolerans]|uniref:Uncharacterized protein n=1 Tax=Natrinema thermotolerans TaxID=121872 RepID=A0AAF0PC57_9EURY|nr:hypothetical protein [Natrinema thermotolerans]WPH65853.1 hypothetical protein HJTV4_gp30 [Haloarchaeal virus HJTV-4]QCC60758.1 hypothetical protein DVR14_19795 [Natrinema thermotolerans]QCC61636.1 hypothetical protein DVR14_23925 [Natrinema thermotolerans]WMT07804.1 hypothetical protein NP511_20820 [Natrinema thermotolerans]WMT08436.1 hypothetical protein NP511_02105 [Natrinema thermotolerans]